MIRGSRFIKNVSANTLQLIINQGFGLIVFYLLSRNLDKAAFGNFNWSLAVLLTSFGILACGIDQLVIKKIAGGENRSVTISLYFLHVVAAGVVFYTILLLTYSLFPASYIDFNLLLFLSIGKLLGFFSTPFKQLCIGLEEFRSLLFMSVGSSIIKAGVLVPGYIFYSISIKTIVIVFIIADFIELLVSVLVARKFITLSFPKSVDLKKYKLLFKEALPQLGTVIFAVAMARLDWILIGVFLYSASLAEYSFAYKIFELSTLPLLIIAPLLIPMFSRLFKDDTIEKARIDTLKFLLSIELVIACLTSMVLVILWTPIIDYITHGKYGAVNKNTIFILSLCIPLLYFNNFLWTINFSRSRLKMILFIFAVTFAVNAVSNFILIPTFGNEGAAAAYLLCLLVQASFFLRTTKIVHLNNLVSLLLICSTCALLSGVVSTYFFKQAPVILITSVCIYLPGVFICLRFSIPQYKMLQSALKG